MIGCGYFFLIIQNLAPTFQRHFHIGLSGTDPYLPNHYVLQHQFPTIGQCKLIRATRFRSTNGKLPSPFLISQCFIRLPIPGSGYFTAFIGFASPHIGASACCCNTMLSENIGGNTTLAEIVPDNNSKAATNIHLFFISVNYFMRVRS